MLLDVVSTKCLVHPCLDGPPTTMPEVTGSQLQRRNRELADSSEKARAQCERSDESPDVRWRCGEFDHRYAFCCLRHHGGWDTFMIVHV